jgi:tetratricopeptide (TPR) repeat protein
MNSAGDKKRFGSFLLALTFGVNLTLPAAIAQGQAQQTYVPPSKYKRSNQYALAGMQTTQPVGTSIPLAMTGIPYGVNPTMNVPSATWKGPSANVASYTACDSVAHTQSQKLVKLGKLDHARQVVLTSLRSHPGDQRLRRDLLDIDLKRAKYFNSQKQFDFAGSALREALYWVPTSAVAVSALNDILRAQGINASDANARLKLADVFAGQNKNTDAFVEYRMSANITATAAAYIGLGNIAYRFGEMKEAKGFYGQAVSLEPNLASSHRQLGLFDLAINDLVGANSELSRALILDPTDQVSARSLVGLWQRQVSMNTNDVNNHLGLARAYLLAGDLKSAQQEYRQVVLIDPQNPQLPAARMGFKLALSRQEVARAYEAARGFETQGNFSAAIQSVQSALRIEPNNIQLLNYDGSLWEKLGRFENARSAYLAVLKQDQANTFAIQRLNALASAGGLDAARVGTGSVGTASGLGVAAASAGGAALGAALPAIMSPPPVAKIETGEEVNSIAGLLGHVRTVAAGEKMRITKGENTVQSLMGLMEKMNAGGGGAGGLDLSNLLGGGAGGANASSSGLPPGIAALLGGAGGSGGSSSSGLPAGLSALLGSIGGASGLAALLGGAKGGSGLPPGIAALLGGGGASKPATTSAGLEGLPPNIQAIVNGTAQPKAPLSAGANASITAGVPPSVAAILGAVPVPAAAATSAVTSSMSSKTVSTKKVESKKGKTTAKKTTTASKSSKATTTSASNVGAEVAAAGAGAAVGGGLAGFMPIIQMAMERFTTLEQQTKTMQQQLEEARQQLQVLQSRPPCGGNYVPPTNAPFNSPYPNPISPNSGQLSPSTPANFLPMTPQLDTMPGTAAPSSVAQPTSSALPAAGEAALAGGTAAGVAAIGMGAMPPLNSPVVSSAGSGESVDGSAKKKEKQNKVRLEIEGVRPDILGIKFKVVLKNDENHSIPVPADPTAVMRKLKVSFPATSVPAHGELHGSIKYSIP